MTHPTVTQADRELAADILQQQDGYRLADRVRAGGHDSSNTVQTIARHRTATEASTAARIAALEAENGKLREAVDGWRIQHERLRESLAVARAAIPEGEGA